MVKKVLKREPKQRLKVHLLRGKVLDAVGLKDDGGKMMKKISKLPEIFAVCEKFVRLL